MNSLNSILIEGNVVRDPVVRETSRGSTVCSFSIASNRFYRQDDELEQETSFFEVESWAKLADACRENLAKGRGVRVVGRLKQDRWTGADGKSYSRIKVVAEHVEFKPVFRGRPASDAVSDESAGVSPEDAETEGGADIPAGGNAGAELCLSGPEASPVF